jgi:hypothetical protein
MIKFRPNTVGGGQGACDVVVSDVFRPIWRHSTHAGISAQTCTGTSGRTYDGGDAVVGTTVIGGVGAGSSSSNSNTNNSTCGWCDAIITDPPYGLRERRTGADSGLVRCASLSSSQASLATPTAFESGALVQTETVCWCGARFTTDMYYTRGCHCVSRLCST